MEEIELEIERLKSKKVELVSKLNLASDFEEKEDLQEQLERIEKQIAMLERFRK
jgi:hypothetical protein